MKRTNWKGLILCLAAMAALAVWVRMARADSYTVTLTTFNPTGSAGEFTSGNYPNISGTNREMRALFIANNGPQDTVELYKNCTSSSAASLAMSIVVKASETWPSGSGQHFPAQLFLLSNPCIRKSSTTGIIKATIMYDTDE